MIQLRVLNVIGAKNWDMSHLRGRLPNIRKLRVTKSMCYFNNNMFSEMGNIELLDFSGNTISRGMTSLSGPANSSSLKTVTIDGCDGLEIISFRNCKELKNLFLTGSFGSLEELDLSGTKVKTLDLGGVESTHPERIILLGCEKLRAILWPESVIKEEKGQYVLRIDTTSTSASTDGGESTHAHPHCDQSLQQQKEKLFKDGWQISFMDARILRPLSPGFATLHLDIYSPAILGGCVQGTSSDELVQVQPHTSTIMDSEYRDAAKDGPVEVMIMWECPGISTRWWDSRRTCIIKVIMHGQSNKLLDDAPSASSSALFFPNFIYEEATSLHVYDNSSITVSPHGVGWKALRWCRVERCPKLHTVFPIPWGSRSDYFYHLETFWASQLLSDATSGTCQLIKLLQA
nr:uncharacterized protein LOC127308979 [Lolium perenne]